MNYFIKYIDKPNLCTSIWETKPDLSQERCIYSGDRCYNGDWINFIFLSGTNYTIDILTKDEAFLELL